MNSFIHISAATVLQSLVVSLLPISLFAIPPWGKENTQSLNGSIYRVVCVGEGPAVDIARKEAVSSCKSSATQLLNTNVNIHTLVIRTEEKVAFHEEINSRRTYSGLKCIPEKEEIEEAGGHVKLWLQCKFDLSAIRVIATKSNSDSDSEHPQADNSSSGIKNKGSLSRIKVRGNDAKVGRYIASERTLLSIATVPQCSNLLVSGEKPRIIECQGNPVTVLVEPTDQRIVIRTDGYQPKEITFSKGRKSNETIQIILDPM